MKLTMVEAIRDGLQVALQRDEQTVVLGEDVGKNGGVFRATEGLWEEFGDHRVIDTPLSEAGIIGASIGMALNGMKPIAEMQFLTFLYPAFEQVISHVARLRTRIQSAYPSSLVIRAPYGGGIRAPELHCDSTETYFVHTPGLQVVVPATPKEAKGLLLAAIESPDPVLFMEPMKIYRTTKEEVPEGYYTTPLHQAQVLQEGTDVTVIAWGAMVPLVQQASKVATEKGISCEVLNLRSLYPIDEETIIRSVQKTGRVVVVHEAPRTAGLAAELFALIQEKAFYHLEAPMVRVTSPDVPVPMFALEDHFRPDLQKIVLGLEQAIKG
ncbi:alpha-ketoacid dehydrogenase subunit beta [Risungbinella massiliensis]|uniref:alpha-ketoacid dehydrogenase subunit beta n=1 Tax=Risungbinella massiliensis TaxID=1329796 RepID=UPI0005CC6B87|nr:alpha-ketoacid dehydrogenase subunit beta [Risungbinella massiliensis]